MKHVFELILCFALLLGLFAAAAGPARGYATDASGAVLSARVRPSVPERLLHSPSTLSRRAAASAPDTWRRVCPDRPIDAEKPADGSLRAF